MPPNEVELCNAEGFESLLDALADQIVAARRPGVPIALVGVRTRGVPIAERLAARVAGPVAVGAVDITLYRDDLAEVDHWPVLLGTEIPFAVDGVDVVLVDDVLFTGRTARAAINAVCDLGRPARVRLAALVDRGHREVPIRADHAGLTVETEPDEVIRVRVRPVDPVDGVVRSAGHDAGAREAAR